MDAIKQRVYQEQSELEQKLDKLNAFNQSDKFQELNDVHKSFLLIQAGAMYTYNEVLKARLSIEW